MLRVKWGCPHFSWMVYSGKSLYRWIMSGYPYVRRPPCGLQRIFPFNHLISVSQAPLPCPSCSLAGQHDPWDSFRTPLNRAHLKMIHRDCCGCTNNIWEWFVPITHVILEMVYYCFNHIVTTSYLKNSDFLEQTAKFSEHIFLPQVTECHQRNVALQ